MTMITSPLEKQGLEQQPSLLTSPLTEPKKKYTATSFRIVQLISSLAAQISAEPANAEDNKDYMLYLPKSLAIGSMIYADKLKDIHEETVRNHNYEIAIYHLAQPVEPQANFIKTDPKEQRRGRFLSPPLSNFSTNLPRIHKKVEGRNHQRQRCQELGLYLDCLKNEVRKARNANFSERVLDLSRSVWEALKSSFEAKELCLEVPDACPGSKDNFMYTWSKFEHYLECEIFATGEIEFFYRNRNTREVWGEDTTLEQGFSTDIFDKASFFIE